jgi:hypothetical protein
MMIILHFIFEMLENPVLKVELSRFFLNAFICTRFSILRNGLHVDEISFQIFKLMGL